MRVLLVLLLCSAPAFAADFSLLQSDKKLSRAEAVAMTQAHRIEFYEGGIARYSTGGSYSYTYDGGRTAFGTFEIGPEGIICIRFQNGRGRCDQFVRSHGRLVMITESGDRFPIRP